MFFLGWSIEVFKNCHSHLIETVNLMELFCHLIICGAYTLRQLTTSIWTIYASSPKPHCDDQCLFHTSSNNAYVVILELSNFVGIFTQLDDIFSRDDVRLNVFEKFPFVTDLGRGVLSTQGEMFWGKHGAV